MADAFPDKKVSLPVVYKKVDLKSLFNFEIPKLSE